MFKAEHMGVSPSQASSHTKNYSCAKQSVSEEKPECGAECKCTGISEQKNNLSEIVQTKPGGTRSVLSPCGGSDALQLSSEVATKDSLTENLDPLSEDACKISLIHKCKSLELPCEDAKRSKETEKSSFSQPSMSKQIPEFPSDGGESPAFLGTPHASVDEHWNREQSETPSKSTVSNSGRLGLTVKTTAKSRKKYMLRSLRPSDRVLRCRSQEKPRAPESSANEPNVNSNIEKRRKRKKKRQGRMIEADEYSRIRTHLRYLLNRISYEQSLITAYSAEGWKGLSLEKLKPEKELQRATSEILRRKSKIRDLFQLIDSLCAEGRFPESLFDSDGQISSEDIFCAKCGSKDFTADNDIILCDGACDRGFHQFCLVPPLLKEEIPPDDEGWLCPGCDCKVDCIGLLNYSQGTNISISDSWEKVFPEAAAGGQNPDQESGLPSDDSDDNDYDPNSPEIDEQSQEDESSSDDSDFTSDELEAPADNKQQLGLSSEDSEDDDYDPDAPDLDDIVKEESSSSDFTSDSEDLAATLDKNELSGEDKIHTSIGAQADPIRKGSKRGQKKKEPLDGDLLSVGEQNHSQDGSVPKSGKRNVERLDYKKLYDETYGNVSSDSSDDEDFSDAVGPTRSRRYTEAVASANGNAAVTNTGKHDLKETNTPNRSTENMNILLAKAHEGSSQSSSCDKTVRPSIYKRLGEAATQGLYKSFKENRYPDRATKESLAKDLGLTFQQVTKWFDNARWSFNHSPSVDGSKVRKASENSSPVPKTITKPLEPGTDTVNRVGIYNEVKSEESPKISDALVEINIEDGRETVLGIQRTSTHKSKTPNSRKRKHDSDNQTSDLESTKEAKAAPANSPKAQETGAGGRVTRSKSVA